jgi:glycosyltransferase involved in cell wall biosynthesis
MLLQLPADFEIVIVDGDSSDGTKELLEELSESYPRVKFQVQQTNLGMDSGYAQAANVSAGKFIMFSGDDDQLEDGSLGRVRTRLLSEPDIELLVLNYSVFDPSLKQALVVSRLGSDAPVEFENYETDEFFERIGGLLTFIGSVLLSRKRWNLLKQEDFLGSYFIHVGAALSSPISGRIALEPQPVFLARGGVPSWDTRAAEIWLFKWPELVQKLEGLSPKFRRDMRVAWKRSLPRAILWQRALGNISWGNFTRLWLNFPRDTKVGKFVLILSMMISFRGLNAFALSRVRRRSKRGNRDLTWELFELLSGKALRISNPRRNPDGRQAGSLEPQRDIR